jgi:hypothetical protein
MNWIHSWWSTCWIPRCWLEEMLAKDNNLSNFQLRNNHEEKEPNFHNNIVMYSLLRILHTITNTHSLRFSSWTFLFNFFRFWWKNQKSNWIPKNKREKNRSMNPNLHEVYFDKKLDKTSVQFHSHWNLKEDRPKPSVRTMDIWFN